MTTFDGRLTPRPDGGTEALMPTPTVQCHAANLAFLPNGDLACVWFGGTQEGVSDISVHLSRLRAGTDQWLDPVQLSFDSSRSEQNPILFNAPNGDVWLLYTGQIAGNQDSSIVRRRVSHDGGETWDMAADRTRYRGAAADAITYRDRVAHLGQQQLGRPPVVYARDELGHVAVALVRAH